MKKKFHKYIMCTAFICLALSAYSIDKDKDKQEFRKEVKESFSISSDALLDINTSFTSVTIENWSKNEVEVFGEIIVEAKNEEAAEKIFKKIDLDFSGGGSEVNIKSDLNSKNDNCNNKDEGYQIIITIKAPSSVNLDADVSFGDINIDRIDGKSDIELSFGSLYADHLNNDKNDIFVEFGSGEIDNLAADELRVSFSSFNADHVSAISSIENSYGQLELDDFDSSSSYLEIANSFGDINLNLASTVRCTVDAKSSFGSVNFSSGFDVRIISEGMFDIHEKATLNGGGILKIDVSNSYGDVSIHLP